jgi:hypothetical protein
MMPIKNEDTMRQNWVTFIGFCVFMLVVVLFLFLAGIYGEETPSSPSFSTGGKNPYYYCPKNGQCCLLVASDKMAKSKEAYNEALAMCNAEFKQMRPKGECTWIPSMEGQTRRVELYITPLSCKQFFQDPSRAPMYNVESL